MTNTQVTQADQEQAELIARDAFDENVNADWFIKYIARKLAKVREEVTKERDEYWMKQSEMPVNNAADEAVAAVVDRMRQILIERGYEEDSHYIYANFDELRDYQQILAERDKRTIREAIERQNDALLPLGIQIDAEKGSFLELMAEIQKRDKRFQEKAEARMREPMECGHSKANWEYSEQHGYMSYGEPTFQDVSYCSACAQQPELREEEIAEAIEWAVEGTLKLILEREECPKSWDAGFPSYKVSALLEYNARRALGEKG